MTDQNWTRTIKIGLYDLVITATGNILQVELNKQDKTQATAHWGRSELESVTRDFVAASRETGHPYEPRVVPIPMLIWCPQCGKRHVDVGEFATYPHETHACQHCGHVWKPAKVPTVGVQFLPGYKDTSTPATKCRSHFHPPECPGDTRECEGDR